MSSQKQIGSWSSKGKLSSPVVYDAVGNQYIAVFSRNELRLWTEHEENLDKVKKMKVRIIQPCTVLRDLENLCSVLDCGKYCQYWENRVAFIFHLFTDAPVVHLWLGCVVGLPFSLQKVRCQASGCFFMHITLCGLCCISFDCVCEGLNLDIRLVFLSFNT